MKRQLWLPAICLLVSSLATFAQVDSYTIHESTYVDEGVDATVDSTNGDILVAWTEYVVNTAEEKDIRAWVCFMKRNPNGTYTAAAPKMISAEGVYAHDLVVAYSSVSKSFLVVYAVGLSNPVTVYATIVKKGKVRKTRELWIEDNGFAGNSMAVAGLNKKSKVPGNKASFVIARRTDVPELGAQEDSIYLFPVSSKGKNTGSPIIMQAGEETGEVYPGGRVHDLYIGLDGTIYTSLRWSAGINKYNMGVIVAGKDGSYKGRATLQSDSDKGFAPYLRITQASKKSVYIGWKYFTETPVYYQTVSNKGSALDSEREVFEVGSTWHDYGLVADSKGTVFFFRYNVGGEGELFKLGRDGEVADTASFNTSSPRLAQYAMGAIPQNNELMLVSNANADSGKTSIIVRVIDPAGLFQ